MVSLFIYVMVIGWWGRTLVENLFFRANPGIYDVTSEGAYGQEEAIDLMGLKSPKLPDSKEPKKRRIQTAFRVVNFDSTKELSNDSIVKWQAFYVTSATGIPN